MATPPGPDSDHSPATEHLPDSREETPDERAAYFPDSPPDASPPADQTYESWPATEQSPVSTDEAAAVEEYPANHWEVPADASALPSNGEYPYPESFPNAETGAESFAQNGEADPLNAGSAAYGWDETSVAQDQDTGMDPADSSPLFLGRRPLYKRSEPAPTAEQQLSNIIVFLQRLQTTIRNAALAAEPPPATLGLSILQLKRLTRTGVAPDHFEIGVMPKPPRIEPSRPTEVDSEPAADRPAEPGEATLPAKVESGQLPPPPEPVRLERRHVVWLVLIGGLCFVTLGLVGYLWTRVIPLSHASVAPQKPAARGMPGPTPSAETSEEALKLADLALEAIQQGDFKRASDTLAKAQKQGLVLPGLYYQEALLALGEGQGQTADNFLEKSIAANESVADCWYLRANTLFYSQGPTQAAEAFAEAVAAAPFNPRNYFFRAECLRRNGNAAAAIGQFQQALRCRPNSSDTELILFKIGLTKIETNTDIIFKTELRDRLTQEQVSGDTLLLATADALSRNEFAEAADFLKRAALVLPPRTFQSRIRDYIFQAQSKQPEIAAVLKLTLSAAAAAPNQPLAAPSRSVRTLVDPAARSMAEADPGGW